MRWRGGFGRLWLAAFCSETAEWMLQVALPLHVYAVTGSAASTAATMVLGLLPAVVLSPVAGLLADRLDRRLVACLACAGQAVVALPLLEGGSLAVVYVVMGAQAALAAIVEPVRTALVPQLVGDDAVTAANGMLGVNANLARLAGAWLGGVLLALGGLVPVVVGAAGALVAAACLLAAPFGGVSRVPEAAGRRGLVRDWLAGLAEFRRDRALRVTAVVLAFVSTAQGMFVVLFVVFVTDVLGGSEADVGLLRGVQALGGLAAGLVLATLARRAAPGKLFAWGALTLGICSAVIWNGPHVTTVLGVYVGLFAVVGFPGVLSGAGSQAVLQTATAPELTGRVLSTAFAGTAAFTALGMLLAGALTGVVGLPVLLDAQAALHITGGLVALAGYGGRRAQSVRNERPARHTPGQRGVRRRDPAGVVPGLAAGRRGRGGAAVGGDRHAGPAA
ncbi:MFS transporter [Prauserella sp. ASG 168]|uniref:MFS transporter n=1 Tax=Prauserella cavernicola TaxID=2800127 RepID=A0A934V2I7_9PSEU|nr:MFS transporter [Prauserella cavernicola]